MRRDFGIPHKGGEKLTEVSVNFASSAQPLESPARAVELMHYGLRSLARLGSMLAAQEFSSLRLNRPLRVEQLQMIEAELRNQGLLKTRSVELSALAQQIEHEVNMLKWRARRAAIWDERCRFLVHLPSFVAHRAQQLVDVLATHDNGMGEYPTHRASAEISMRAHAELQYLNDLASYLVGETGEGKNRYERGLDLVLKVLAEKDAAGENGADALLSAHLDTDFVFVLPMLSKDFLSALRNSPKR